MVKPCLASLAFAATRPRLTPDDCRMIAYTTPEMPSPLASPNACNSIAWISSRNLINDRGALTRSGNFRSHSNNFFFTSSSSGTSHPTFFWQISRYIIFPCRVCGEARPNGSYTLASFCNVPLLVGVADSDGMLTLI